MISCIEVAEITQTLEITDFTWTSDPQNHCLLGSQNRVAVNFLNRYVIYWVGLGPCERARPEVAEYVLGKGIVRKGGGLPPLSANFFPLVFRKNSIIGKIGPIVSVRLAAFSQFFFYPSPNVCHLATCFTTI